MSERVDLYEATRRVPMFSAEEIDALSSHPDRWVPGGLRRALLEAGCSEALILELLGTQKLRDYRRRAAEAIQELAARLGISMHAAYLLALEKR